MKNNSNAIKHINASGKATHTSVLSGQVDLALSLQKSVQNKSDQLKG